MTASAGARSELDLYRWMVVARALDRALCAANPRWFPIEGEEATVVGALLRPAARRRRGAALPRSVRRLPDARRRDVAARGAGAAARAPATTRAARCRSPARSSCNIVPWVAGDLGTSLGIATGAALAFQQEGSDRVCVCTFGDGTANRGDFHENVNLAACWRLPIVYVCQHNGWAISQPAETYLPAPIVDRAAGYGIPGVAVDGNDVEAVRAAVGEAVARARRGDGPTPDRGANLARRAVTGPAIRGDLSRPGPEAAHGATRSSC